MTPNNLHPKDSAIFWIGSGIYLNRVLNITKKGDLTITWQTTWRLTKGKIGWIAYFNKITLPQQNNTMKSGWKNWKKLPKNIQLLKRAELQRAIAEIITNPNETWKNLKRERYMVPKSYFQNNWTLNLKPSGPTDFLLIPMKNHIATHDGNMSRSKNVLDWCREKYHSNDHSTPNLIGTKLRGAPVKLWLWIAPLGPIMMLHWVSFGLKIKFLLVPMRRWWARLVLSSGFGLWHMPKSNITTAIMEMSLLRNIAKSVWIKGNFPGVGIGHTWNFNTKFKSLVCFNRESVAQLPTMS